MEKKREEYLETKVKELRTTLFKTARRLHRLIQAGEVEMIEGREAGNHEVPCEFVCLADLVLCYRDDDKKMRF